MGFRTVVVLSNDHAHEWEKDPELGRKIFMAASIGNKELARRELPYGHVVECVHADTQTLAILDGYSGRPVAYTHWHRGQTSEQQELVLLKELAEKHGKILRSKPKKV